MRDSEQRDKWVVRIFAFLTACALWLYVMNEQNPIIERSFTIPLTKANLAENMVVNNLQDTVIVKIKGTRTMVSSAREKDLQAFIDFTGAVKGRHTYSIVAASEVGDVIEISPKTVSLDLDVIGERLMDVEARIMGSPESGVAVGKLDLEPQQVRVTGASNRLANAFKVIALVDITGKETSFEDEANLTPIALDGSEMYDLSVVPGKVSVKALMLKQLAKADIPIVVPTTGSLKEGYKVRAITSIPKTIKITAEPAMLAELKEIKTGAVNLDNISGDVELQMPLDIPEKALVETHSALVKIEIERTK
ncbi:MAG TPA: hypothetical protein IAB06_00115 [Candidatus Avacidaminococcus intestinavium]|uniref:YbbR-like protein n=1 Tax=Candidatus Avacidaminococcus intestinavium TaxID=2840684 RepID=A0A9D1MMS7_9FIRM|nr:hypothetical protein [Candidatus Avacidaminococcus intestinavium]